MSTCVRAFVCFGAYGGALCCRSSCSVFMLTKRMLSVVMRALRYNGDRRQTAPPSPVPSIPNHAPRHRYLPCSACEIDLALLTASSGCFFTVSNGFGGAAVLHEPLWRTPFLVSASRPMDTVRAPYGTRVCRGPRSCDLSILGSDCI